MRKGKKRSLVFGTICIVMLFTGCVFNHIEVVLDNQLEVSEKVQDTENQSYNLVEDLSETANIKIKGQYTKESTSVLCEIEAPDIYSFLMDDMENLMELSEEELYKKIMEYAQDKDSPTRSVEIELPAYYEDDKLIVETDSFEYQDAVTGGINSALSEIYTQILQEVKGESNE